DRSSLNNPANPPMSPITSGREVRRTLSLSSLTACSPAWMDTPASAYVTVRLRPVEAFQVWCSDSARSLTCVTVLPFVRRGPGAVGANGTADPLVVQPAGDQLGAGGEVDAVEARPLDRRRGDAYVHLQRTGLAQHPDDRPLGVAAHDRVVHDHDPLAPHALPQRVELEPDAQLADRLRGLDEGTPDVAVLDQPGPVRAAGLLGVADRGGRAGLGYRDHQVGLDRVLGGQPPADRHPGLVH